MSLPLIIGLGLVAALVSCTKSDEEKKEKIGPDPDARPAPAPKKPRDLFSQCFGSIRDFEIIVEHPGRGLCGRLSRSGFFAGPLKPEWKACFPSDPACDFGPGIRFGRPFHLIDEVFTSAYPRETGISPHGSLLRSNTLSREEVFHYLPDGGLYDDCRFFLQMWQGTAAPGGRHFSLVNVPLYAPRKDGQTCMAEPDFSNEKILRFGDAPLCATFPAPGAAPSSVTATEVKAGSGCGNRMGTALPLKVTIQFK